MLYDSNVDVENSPKDHTEKDMACPHPSQLLKEIRQKDVLP